MPVPRVSTSTSCVAAQEAPEHAGVVLAAARRRVAGAPLDGEDGAPRGKGAVVAGADGEADAGVAEGGIGALEGDADAPAVEAAEDRAEWAGAELGAGGFGELRGLGAASVQRPGGGRCGGGRGQDEGQGAQEGCCKGRAHGMTLQPDPAVRAIAAGNLGPWRRSLRAFTTYAWRRRRLRASWRAPNGPRRTPACATSPSGSSRGSRSCWRLTRRIWTPGARRA